MQPVNYDLLIQELAALTDGVPYEIANLANASALLWQNLPDINWAGFYKMEGGILVLYPFQGKTACTRIAVGKGVWVPRWRRIGPSWCPMSISSPAISPAIVPPIPRSWCPSM